MLVMKWNPGCGPTIGITRVEHSQVMELAFRMVGTLIPLGSVHLYQVDGLGCLATFLARRYSILCEVA